MELFRQLSHALSKFIAGVLIANTTEQNHTYMD